MLSLSESIISSNDAGILDNINKWAEDNWPSFRRPVFEKTKKGLVMSGEVEFGYDETPDFPCNVKIIPHKTMRIKIYGTSHTDKKPDLIEKFDDSVPFKLEVEYVGKFPKWIYDLNLSMLTIGTSVDMDSIDFSKISKDTSIQFNVSAARELIKFLTKKNKITVK